jgi:hypothetical protein
MFFTARDLIATERLVIVSSLQHPLIPKMYEMKIEKITKI